MSFIILFTVKTVKIVDHLYSLIIYCMVLLNLSRVYSFISRNNSIINYRIIIMLPALAFFFVAYFLRH